MQVVIAPIPVMFRWLVIGKMVLGHLFHRLILQKILVEKQSSFLVEGERIDYEKFKFLVYQDRISR